MNLNGGKRDGNEGLLVLLVLVFSVTLETELRWGLGMGLVGEGVMRESGNFYLPEEGVEEDEEPGYMNCSVLSLALFIFYQQSPQIPNKRLIHQLPFRLTPHPAQRKLKKGLTAVLISNTSLNPILVSANLLCNIMTTLLLCSDTCFAPTPFLFVVFN